MKKLKHTKVKRNFKYPKIKASDRTYGVSLGNIIRENGDWRDYLPPDELQNQNGVESSGCYVEAQQATIATIQEEQFNLPDQNYSARLNTLLSNGTESGGDPIAGAKSIKYDGLVFEEDMPFKDISNWSEYHSWKGVDENKIRAKAKEFLEKWSLNFKILVERDIPLKTKYQDLREGLKRSPVDISVCAWYEANGEYYKPQGKRDNHFVEAVYVDDKDRIYIRDTYYPHLKILAPKTNFEFALTWVVEKRPYEQKVNLLKQLIALLGKWIGLIEETPKEPVKPPETPKISQPEPSKREQLFAVAKKYLGTDNTPQDLVPDEVACAEHLCTIIRHIDPSFPIIPFTGDLLKELKRNPKYKATLDVKEGHIVINATGTGNNTVRGHCGIFVDGGKIASNNSVTGKWDNHWVLGDWVNHYRVKGGMPTHIFTFNEKTS
jgi:hypothetical protein